MLTSIVMGMLYNVEKKEAYKKGKKKLNNYCCDEGRIIKNLTENNKAKREKAERDLRQWISKICRENGFDPADFGPAHLNDGLREKVDKLSINLLVFSAEAGHSLVFNHPHVYDTTRPSVSLYLARAEEEEKKRALASKKRKKETKKKKKKKKVKKQRMGAGDQVLETHAGDMESNESSSSSEGEDEEEREDRELHGPDKELLYHCGLIKQEKKFLSHQGHIRCHFCRRSFSVDYFKMHLCRARETCKKCRRIKLNEDDYVDFEIARLRCVPPSAATHADLPCDHCGQVCNTQQCRENHQTLCKHLGYCEKCRKVFRKKKDGRPHQCGDDFCKVCAQPYNKLSFRKHQCKLQPTSLQTTHAKVGVYDFETIVNPKTGRHRVNLAALIRESPEKSGVFDQIGFCDKKMNHEKSGVLEEGVYEYQYWPDRMTPYIDKIRKKPPRRVRNLYGPTAAKRQDVETSVTGDDKKKKKKKEKLRQTLVLQYLDAEAAHASADSDDEDEDEELADSDDDEDIMLQHEREVLPQKFGEDVDKEEGEGGEGEGADFGDSALSQFLDFVLTPAFFGYTLLAHNAAKFDAVLLLNALHKKNVKVDVLYDGNKILQMVVKPLKLRFIDSMKFIKGPLSSFKKRFPKIDYCDTPKGSFPYLFNKVLFKIWLLKIKNFNFFLFFPYMNRRPTMITVDLSQMNAGLSTSSPRKTMSSRSRPT